MIDNQCSHHFVRVFMAIASLPIHAQMIRTYIIFNLVFFILFGGITILQYFTHCTFGLCLNVQCYCILQIKIVDVYNINLHVLVDCYYCDAISVCQNK